MNTNQTSTSHSTLRRLQIFFSVLLAAIVVIGISFSLLDLGQGTDTTDALSTSEKQGTTETSTEQDKSKSGGATPAPTPASDVSPASSPITFFRDAMDAAKTDKGPMRHAYYRYYWPWLHTMKQNPIRMLEIGLDTGASVKLWDSVFLNPDARIFGLDVGSDVVARNKELVAQFGERVKVISGDQSKEEDLERVCKAHGPFDLVVDDGSHVPEHQQLTARYMFKNCLKPGGIMVVEDVETSFWQKGSLVYSYPITQEFDFVAWMHQVALLVNREFCHSPDFPHEEMKWFDDLEGVMFGQNCVVLMKSREDDREFLRKPYVFPALLRRDWENQWNNRH